MLPKHPSQLGAEELFVTSSSVLKLGSVWLLRDSPHAQGSIQFQEARDFDLGLRPVVLNTGVIPPRIPVSSPVGWADLVIA